MPAITAPFRMEQLGDTLYLAVSSAHTFGSDAFLLARFAGEALRRGDAAADLGTGCGIIAFLLYKTGAPGPSGGSTSSPPPSASLKPPSGIRRRKGRTLPASSARWKPI